MISPKTIITSKLGNGLYYTFSGVSNIGDLKYGFALNRLSLCLKSIHALIIYYSFHQHLNYTQYYPVTGMEYIQI